MKVKTADKYGRTTIWNNVKELCAMMNQGRGNGIPCHMVHTLSDVRLHDPQGLKIVSTGKDVK